MTGFKNSSQDFYVKCCVNFWFSASGYCVLVRMPKSFKIRRILKNKANITEYISNKEEDGYKFEDERGKEDSGSDSENTYIVRRRKHRSIRKPLYSDGSYHENSEISADGTNWINR